jgi:tetraacyldisaccharide 4'-kinase
MSAPDFWNRRGPLALLLAPLGELHGMSVAYKARGAKPYRPAVQVICVGNLTAGGSGKTPVALEVAQMLIARGKKVFFLTRGYGGNEPGPLLVSGQDAAGVGDEALLLARVAPTIVAHDRAAGAKLAIAKGAEVIVMDDGHQNFSLAKDLSLVVTAGFGNGLMIPAGPLRETVRQGLGRADVVIAMNDTAMDGHQFSGPILKARLIPDGASFSCKRVYAFAGIGHPEKFLRSLQDAGAIITGSRFFADHHPYTPSEIASLRRDAKDAVLVTTEKDFVRLAPELQQGIQQLTVRVQFDQPALLDRLFRAV